MERKQASLPYCTRDQPSPREPSLPACLPKANTSPLSKQHSYRETAALVGTSPLQAPPSRGNLSIKNLHQTPCKVIYSCFNSSFHGF